VRFFNLSTGQLLEHIVYVFFRRWWMMSIWFVVLSFSCLFGIFLVTPTYEAVNSVLIQNNYKQQLGIFDKLSSPGVLNPRVNWANNVTSVAQSYDLAAQIVDEFGFVERLRKTREEPEDFRDVVKMGIVNGLMWPFDKLREMGVLGEEDPTDYVSDAIDEFVEDTIDIELVEDTEIIAVAVNERSPELSNAVVDRLVELLIERMKALENDRSGYALTLAEEALVKSEATYKNAMAALESFRLENQVADYAEEKRLQLVAREQVAADLQRVEADLSDARGGQAWVLASMADVKLSPADYRKLTDQRAELELSIASREARRDQLVTALSQVAGKLDGLIAREDTFHKLEEEVTASRSIYSQLRTKRDELLVNQSTLIGEFGLKVIDSIRVSPVADPDWPALILLVPIVFIFCMMTAVMVCFGMEMLAGDYVRGPRGLSELTGLDVVGVVPRWRMRFGRERTKGSGERAGIGIHCWVGTTAGRHYLKYKAIVADLQARAEGGKTVSVMLCSTRDRDGKTHMSLNLAATMALDGQRVLLVDLDARRSSLTRRFKLAPRHGITDLLGGLPPEDFKPLRVEPGFDVVCGTIPALQGGSGRVPPSCGQLRRALDLLAGSYDVILFDGESLAEAPHMRVLAREVGFIYLVVRGLKSLHSEIKQAADLFEKAGHKVDGLVLNRFHDPVFRSVRRAMGSLVEGGDL